MKSLSAEEQTLLSLISNALFDNPVGISNNVDWKSVIREANAQAVLPLMLNKTDLLPLEIRPIAEKQIMNMLANNIRIESNHICTHKLMNNAGVPYVILKGCSSAYYYPEPIYRTMGDVDFLIAEENLGLADEVLRRAGFESWDENHICHTVYRKPGMHLELHWEPAGMPEGKPGELVRSYMNDVFDTAVEVEVGSGKIMLPDDFHHGLILLLHTCHHLTGEGVGLRHLCDWAVFVNHLSYDRFRKLFEEKLKTIGLWQFAQLLTQLSAKYLGMPEKALVDENVDCAILSAMIRDIFDSGNFGAKDRKRLTETMIISSRGKNGVGHTSMFHQVVKNINQTIHIKWPVSIKFKLLLPLGWIFYGSRYILRIILGKREKPNISKTVSGARERRELYKSFHLYEV